MNRKKLMIEKIADGEAEMRLNPNKDLPVWGLGYGEAQRFHFESEDLEALQEIGTDAIIFALRTPPYESMWLEIQNNGPDMIDLIICGYYDKPKDILVLFADTDGPTGKPCLMEIGYGSPSTFGTGHEDFRLHTEAVAMYTEAKLIYVKTGLIETPTPKIIAEYTAYKMRMLLLALTMFHVQGDIKRDVMSVEPKLNAKRIARGKVPLRSYTYIHLNHEADSNIGSGNEVGSTKARHLVRGHFKVCRTGIFWWRPHFAGHGALKERAGYKVMA